MQKLFFCIDFLDLQRIRLVNEDGVVNNETGRLEVLVNGSWGTVCSDTGDNRQLSMYKHTTSRLSKVICSMYGYTGVGVVVNFWVRRTGKTPEVKFVWTELNCRGDEISIFDCDHSTDLTRPWDMYTNCEPGDELGIYCF